MKNSSPYQIIKRRYITEKAQTLQNLKTATSNRSLARCESPKYVFLVDPSANKQQIAAAVEEIYGDRNVKVTAVNTINVKAKPTRRIRSYGKTVGKKASYKKAIVTLAPQDSLED